MRNRVLEQFLSSNITERNELIESYLVGNRLFKFLSVVLPTHHQYFSSDPRLEELRNGSESQLMELLDCMEELELMIDEMEYNRYILKDLTPSEANDKKGLGYMTTNGMLQNDWVADENSRKRLDIRENNRTILAGETKISKQLNQERPSEKQQQKQQHQNATLHVDQCDDSHGKFQGGNVKKVAQMVKASNQAQKNLKSPNQHQILKERVAAVLKASSNEELSTNFRRSIRSSSSRPIRSSSLSATSEKKHSDSFPDMTHMEFQDSSSKSFDNQGFFGGTGFQPNSPESRKNSTEQHRRQKARQPLHDSPGDPQMSWDADFSQFNVFSSDKIQSGDSMAIKPKNTNIDLLLQDPCHIGKKQSASPKPFPRIKGPPASYPRSVWSQAQVHAARSPSFERRKLNSNELNAEALSAFSDCSSDIFYSLEDPQSEPEPVKTKIEERLEHAMMSRGHPSGDKNVPLVLEANSNRKLLNQFRGCVRFLLD